MLIKICVPAYKGLINPVLKATIKTLMTMETEHVFSYSAWSQTFADISRNEAIFASPLKYPELPRIGAVIPIDADMEPTPEEILKMIDTFIEGKHDVLGCVYKKNSPVLQYCVQVQKGPSENKLYQGVIPVYTMGFGCSIIGINVLAQIAKPWFNAYFITDEHHWQHIPEDESFCLKVRDAGFKVYCDFSNEIKHSIVPVEELDRRMAIEVEKEE
jgi:hypothetical protein